MSDKPSQTTSSSGQRIRRNAWIVSIFTLISRILGAIRELALLHIFGAGAVYDAFIIAMTIPNTLRRLTAEGSLVLVFVPLYTELKENEGTQSAREFAQKVISLVIIATSLLTALGIFFSADLVHLFASGYEEGSDKFNLTVGLTKVMFPYLIFISLVALAMGVLNAEQHFASPAAAPILLNVSLILAALIFSSNFEQPIMALAWGLLAGGFLQLALQIPFLLNIKQPLVPLGFWKDPTIKRMLRLMGPTLFGVAVYQINIIVLRNIASTLPDGHVSYYNVASRLQEILIGVFAFAYATASLPEFSKHTSQQDWEKAFATLRETISSAMFLILPASAGFVAFALPIVSMLFLHGEFRWEDALICALALQFIILGVPALAIVRILVTVFFAMKDTRTPVIASTITLFVTGFSGWYLSKEYLVVGLVTGLSIGVWVQVFCLTIFLKLKTHTEKGWFPFKELLLYFVVSVFIGLGVHLSQAQISWQQGPMVFSNWIFFIGIMFSAVALYLLLFSVLKDENALSITRYFRISRKT